MEAIEVSQGAHPRSLPVLRPRTRGDCKDVPRPCPFVSCRHNLLVEVGRNGAVALNDGAGSSFPRTASAEAFEAAADGAIDAWYDAATPPRSCALDEVDAIADEMSLDAVGAVLGVTRERARQIEAEALAKVAAPIAALIGRRLPAHPVSSRDGKPKRPQR